MVAEVIESAAIAEILQVRKLSIQDNTDIVVANATANLSITNVAPAAVGTSTISKWLKVDIAGTDYYIPLWT